jgi:hypothetical protein
VAGHVLGRGTRRPLSRGAGGFIHAAAAEHLNAVLKGARFSTSSAARIIDADSATRRRRRAATRHPKRRVPESADEGIIARFELPPDD